MHILCILCIFYAYFQIFMHIFEHFMHIFEFPFSHNYSPCCINIHFWFLYIIHAQYRISSKIPFQPVFASRIQTTSLKSILRGLASSLRRFKHQGVQLSHFEQNGLERNMSVSGLFNFILVFLGVNFCCFPKTKSRLNV